LRKLNSIGAIAGILLASVSVQPALANDPLAPVPISTEKPVDVDPALWVVKDADTTVYLFGTVHVLKPGLGWFDDGVKQAFDASGELVLEMVDPPQDEVMKTMAELSIDTTGKSLRSKLGDADKVALETISKKLGLPVEAVDPLKPWMAAITLYMVAVAQQGFDPAQGAETQLKAAAKVVNKSVIGLETLREQLGFFDSLSEDAQLKYLTEVIASIDEIPAQTEKLVEYWAKAEPEKLAALMNEGMSDPALSDAILYKRNANWATWINGRMAKPGTVFIAVGAGHLAGEKSVQDLLTPYGLKAERVAY
jgi:uncharacterized protein